MLKGWSFIKLIIFTASSRVFTSETGLKHVSPLWVPDSDKYYNDLYPSAATAWFMS